MLLYFCCKAIVCMQRRNIQPAASTAEFCRVWMKFDEKTGPQPQEYDRGRRYVARWSSLTTGQHNVMRLMHLSQIIHNNSYKFSNIHKIIWIRVSNCSIHLRRSATSIFSLYLLFLSNSYRKHEEDKRVRNANYLLSLVQQFALSRKRKLF